MGKLPMFGIGLGHQIMALAKGGDTVKLKFGHRGANHPVKDAKNGRVYITSQNHGYIVDAEKLPKGAKLTHYSLNDNSVEGLAYESEKAFSVQFDPEVSANAEDTGYLYDEFVKMMG